MSEVEMVEKTIKVPKNISEIGEALAALTKSIVEHKGPTEIVLANLEKYRLAIDGYAQVPVEAKADPGKVAVVLALALDEVI